MRTFSRPLSIAGIAAAVLLPVVMSASASSGDEPRSETIAAFERQRTAQDRLPDELQDLPVWDRLLPETSRYVSTFDSMDFYLVRGKSETTCLLYVRQGVGGPPVSAGSCTPTSALSREGVYLAEITGPDSGFVAVVAPNGYSRASARGTNAEVSVRNNVAYVEGRMPDSVTLEADRSEAHDVTIDLGPMAP